MTGNARFILAASLVCCLNLTFLHPSWATWTTEMAVGAGDVMSTSLALDSSGYPCVAYQDHNTGLAYAWRNGSGWDAETVDITGLGGVSLALDSSGNPHIAYSSLDGLKYASWNGSSWSIQTVDNEGQNIYHSTSLAFDSSSNPHISYSGNDTLKYARWDRTSWSVQIVGSGVLDCSLALDSQDNPHISYSGNDTLKYARWDGTSWSREVVESGTGEYNSIALDSSNYPHISYQGYYLQYARWDGTSWSIQKIADGGVMGEGTSLALDSSGNPHISYQYAFELRYARWNGSSWSIETVDDEPFQSDAGSHSSITFDSSGAPHISYAYRRNVRDRGYFLKYARRSGLTESYPSPIVVHPNPCYPLEGQVLTISGIPLSESNIYIYDIAGNLVRILSETEMSVEGESKKAIWNLKNSKGKLVGRGTYVYYIPGAAQNTGKITVIK